MTKQEITGTFNNISFKQSVLAVPQQSTITFCDQVDTSIIDDLGRDIVKITKIATIIIIAVMVLLILANCALEWYKWRCLQNHLEYIRQAWNTDPTVHHYPTTGSTPTMQLTNHNLLTLHGITAHPLLMRIANQISGLLRLSHSKHIHFQWFFSYVFHPPAMACLLIGLVGLLSVQVQLLALGPIADSYRNKALSSATNFSDTIAAVMNQNMLNQSAVYVAQVNSEVDTIQSTINDGVFGWVNSTTTTLNTTLNNFYDEIQDLVHTVFGGTPLDQPMQEFVACLIGSKVDALTNALTFMHDNLHVDMPRMNQSSLELSPQDVNDAARPIALAAIGSGNGDGDDGGIVGRILAGYVKSLEKERIMFLLFICIWGVVVIVALLVIFWHSYIKPIVDRRKKKKWHKEQREGFDRFTAAREPHITVTDESSIENGGRGGMNLPSFTPLASPRPGFLESLTSPRRRIGSHESLSEKEAPPVTKSTVEVNTNTRFGSGWFGRKTIDKEKFVIDVDDEPVVTTGKPAPVSLSSRLAALNPFGRKQQDLKPHISSPILSNPRPGHRSPPNLSINTSRAASSKPPNLPMIETSSPTDHDRNGLKSVWSASPTTPQPPRPVNGGGDGGQGSRNPQAVPLRVRNVDTASDNDNLQRPNAERKPTVVDGSSKHLAPPLHHGYGRSVPLEQPRSVHPPPGIPPPQRGQSPPPFSRYSGNSIPSSGRPLHPGVTRKPAPKPSQDDNPFATPFDVPMSVPVAI